MKERKKKRKKDEKKEDKRKNEGWKEDRITMNVNIENIKMTGKNKVTKKLKNISVWIIIFSLPFCDPPVLSGLLTTLYTIPQFNEILDYRKLIQQWRADLLFDLPSQEGRYLFHQCSVR